MSSPEDDLPIVTVVFEDAIDKQNRSIRTKDKAILLYRSCPFPCLLVCQQPPLSSSMSFYKTSQRGDGLMEPAASSEYLADDEEPPYSVRRLRQAYLERVREASRPRRGFGYRATPSLPYIPEIEEGQRVLTVIIPPLACTPPLVSTKFRKGEPAGRRRSGRVPRSRRTSRERLICRSRCLSKSTTIDGSRGDLKKITRRG